MVGAGAGTGLRIAPTGCSCSIRVVSCMVFPPRMEIGKTSRQRGLRFSRVGYAASGGSAPDIIRRLRLCNWAITWLWCSSCAHEAVGQDIEKPQLIHFAQINFGGVFEDKAADILLMDQVAVAVLLRASCRASEFSLQMAALDPAGYCMGIDPQRLRKAVAGVEAPVILEPHSFQLEVDSSYRACISGRFQLEADAFIAHPCVAGENLPFPLAPRQLFRSGQTQLTSALLQSPMRHADFLCQQPDARARLCLRRAEVDFSDEMVDLVAEDVLAAALGFTSTTIVAADCGRTK